MSYDAYSSGSGLKRLVTRRDPVKQSLLCPRPQMPPPKQQRRRALESLASSRDGCTEAIMLAHGFKVEFLAGLINARLATAQTERMVAGGRPVEVIRFRITQTGSRALSHLRWR
jgi:hypothetical protein